MQIAVIADNGEIIDSVDLDRGEIRAALSGHNGERTMLWNRLDTPPVRRFVGLPERPLR